MSNSREAGEPKVALTAGEVIISIAAATVFPLTCRHIKVDPLDRVGQVSGLAACELRFALAAIALIAALAIADRVNGGRGFPTVARLVCAAIAGLATGLVAGGILVALRGTHYGLNGIWGDTGRIADSADAIIRGEDVPLIYPPGPLYGLAWYAELVHVKTAFALKHLQVMGTAALGPATYLSWRLLLRPAWALGVGLVAALPLIDSAPYKPYSVIVLLAFVPIAIRFLDIVRHAADRDVVEIARAGVGYGLGFGVLCLTYSGWFKWSAPGLLVAGALLFPWRAAPRRAALLVGLVAVMFALVAGRYVHGVLGNVSAIDDKFVYFDTLTEPTYIAMFGGELPSSAAWPPLGELGGVGLFTVVMAVGLGAAIALGRHRTAIITLGSTIACAWLVRFWYAHLVYETKLVQLYPRTTQELLYGSLAMCGLAVYFAAERVRSLRTSSAMIGAAAGLLLLFGSAGSLIADRYMPNTNKDMSFGILAYHAHHPELRPPLPPP